MQPDLSLTLDQLENTDWGEPTYSSYLVRTCHALRKKPLQDFTIEDLRIMIGQNISLDYLMPLAVRELSKNILAEGDFYAGDLLKVVLSAEGGFWERHPGMWQRMLAIFQQNSATFEGNKEYKDIIKAFEGFERSM
jgi:hypothetical protein